MKNYIWTKSNERFLSKAYEYYTLELIAEHLCVDITEIYSKVSKMNLKRDDNISRVKVKKCSKCGCWHLITDYHKKTSSPDGLYYICKYCFYTQEKTYKTKYCYKCGRELPIENFNRDKTSSDGTGNRCRDCSIDSRSKYNKEDLPKQEFPNTEECDVIVKAYRYYTPSSISLLLGIDVELVNNYVNNLPKVLKSSLRGIRRCNKCCETLPLEKFDIDSNSNDYISHYCSKCNSSKEYKSNTIIDDYSNLCDEVNKLMNGLDAQSQINALSSPLVCMSMGIKYVDVCISELEVKVYTLHESEQHKLDTDKLSYLSQLRHRLLNQLKYEVLKLEE